MWVRLCICACVVSSLLRAAVAHGGEQVQEIFEAVHLDHHKLWPRPRALMAIDEERSLAQVDYAGDYAPAHNNKNTASPPPVVKRRRSLLQEYGSWTNQRSPSSPSKEYGSWANQRSTSSPSTKGRKLLQDYSPIANQRIPSSPRRHKP